MNPNSICLLATLRHEELQELAARERLVRLALAPGHERSASLMQIRSWLGAALIDAGARLRGEHQSTGTIAAGHLDRMSAS